MIELHLCDCLEYMKSMPDKSVDAIITDLPYGTTACSWDVVIPFEPMWEQVKRVLKPRGVFVTTASQPFTSKLVMSNPEWFKYCLVWDKRRGYGPGLAKYRPMPSYEEVVIFGKGVTTYNPQTREGEPYKRHTGTSTKHGYNGHRVGYRAGYVSESDGGRYPLSVYPLAWSPSETVHPTQKPVALYEYLILTYTNEGDTVLDFCMGSGTTGVACVQTGRNFIGCEKIPTYFAIAKKRIEDAQRQMILPGV